MLKATEEGDQIRAVNIGSVESQLLPYIVYGQTHYIEVPDSPGRINDESLEEILAAILKCIPECISEADFKRLSDLLPHMEPVYVATSARSNRGELLKEILV